MNDFTKNEIMEFKELILKKNFGNGPKKYMMLNFETSELSTKDVILTNILQGYDNKYFLKLTAAEYYYTDLCMAERELKKGYAVYDDKGTMLWADDDLIYAVEKGRKKSKSGNLTTKEGWIISSINLNREKEYEKCFFETEDEASDVLENLNREYLAEMMANLTISSPEVDGTLFRVNKEVNEKNAHECGFGVLLRSGEKPEYFLFNMLEIPADKWQIIKYCAMTYKYLDEKMAEDFLAGVIDRSIPKDAVKEIFDYLYVDFSPELYKIS